MTPNKATVETYLDGFRKSDHQQILSCLTDDVVWEMPGVFRRAGKDEFGGEIENEGFVGSPVIDVTRMVEEGDVVIAEGTVRHEREQGEPLEARFCDVFVLTGGRISALTSYMAHPG